MSLSPGNRWLFVAPLAGEERQGRGSLGGGGAVVGLSDPLPLRSSIVLGAHSFSGLYPVIHPGQHLRTGSSHTRLASCNHRYTCVETASFCTISIKKDEVSLCYSSFVIFLV